MWRWGVLGLAAGCEALPPDTDTLASLTVDGAVPWPDFDPDRTSYAIARGAVAAGAELVARTTDPKASVEIFVENIDGRRSTSDVVVRQADRFVAMVTSADGTSSRRYEVIFLPDTLPVPDLRTTPGAQPAEGLWFVGTMRDSMSSFMMILDDVGVPLWFRRTGAGVFDFRVRRDGRLGWMSLADDDRGYAGQLVDDRFEVQELVRPTRASDGTVLEIDVHEFMRLPNGSRISLGEYVDAHDLTERGGTPSTRVLHQVLQEVDENGNVLFEWSPRDHLDWRSAEVWSTDTSTNAIGYAHINAMDIDPVDGSWVISARLQNQVLKVARTPLELNGKTFAAGEIVWRLGGDDSDFAFVGDPRLDGLEGFYGQHTVVAMEGDRIQLFDNALNRRRSLDLTDPAEGFTATGDARGAEYQLDTVAYTATLSREVGLDGAGPVRAAGSIQELPNGGALVGWGDRTRMDTSTPLATEFDAAGGISAELYMAPGTWSYRVYKLPFTFPWSDRAE